MGRKNEMISMGRKKKIISPEDLIDVKLKRKDIEHIINQLGIYGMPLHHQICNEEIDEWNEAICRILKKKVVEYPKSQLISPSINAMENGYRV